jgi:hypothetical protein
LPVSGWDGQQAVQEEHEPPVMQHDQRVLKILIAGGASLFLVLNGTLFYLVHCAKQPPKHSVLQLDLQLSNSLRGSGLLSCAGVAGAVSRTCTAPVGDIGCITLIPLMNL